MKEQHMEKKRFDELELQDQKTKCPSCGMNFNLSILDTIGGGYGVIGVKCPRCGMRFAIEGGSEDSAS